MNNQEDLRHLIQKNQDYQRHFNEQIQKQLQQIQTQIDHLHKQRDSGSLQKDSDMDGIFSCCYRWRPNFGTIVWALVIVGLIIGCGWNLREILQDMIDSPTVTKMTYTFHDNISLPPINIYQFSNTPMLHTEKLYKALENGSLTEAYLEVVMGVGFVFAKKQKSEVQPNKIKEAYEKAILQYGSLTEAVLALYREYGIACDELFIICSDDLSPVMNCCDNFELLWGLQGPQYTLERNTIVLDIFRSFLITLRNLPYLEALEKGDFVEQPRNYQPYSIGITNGVDQTGIDPHLIDVWPSEVVTILLRQKRRNIKISKDCVDIPPKLQYFREYTIRNCFFEHCMLDKLSLCNISCEIPLLQLISQANLSGPPCEFDVLNSTCWEFFKDNHIQCSTTHACRFPCNYTEFEYGVTKGLNPGDQRDTWLYFQYETTEVQTLEETSRLTLWECLGLTSSILDLWLGITIYTLYRLLHRCVSKTSYFKALCFGKNNSAAGHSAHAERHHEMANMSIAKRDQRVRSSSYY